MWIRALENTARNARPNGSRKASFEMSRLEVRMFHVGHGEAILLTFPGEKAWLIDGGCTNGETKNRQLAQLILDYLEEKGLTLEVCVPSHPHIDHAGALETIIASGSPSLASTITIYRAEDAWSLDTKWLRRYHQVVDAAGPSIQEVILRRAHREIAPTEDIDVHIFAGSGDGPYTSTFMQLRFRGAQLLFMGDAHCSYEAELLEQVGAQDFRADVLKVTHHGSSDGTSNGLIAAAAPSLAIAIDRPGRRTPTRSGHARAASWQSARAPGV
jgi:competence protein ComEC